jgi:hypothetical protein
MLESAKNLVKFVKSVNPDFETAIRVGIGFQGQINCFFDLSAGNGREVLAKLVTCPTVKIETRESSTGEDKYLDIKGEFDGYEIEVTFLNNK